MGVLEKAGMRSAGTLQKHSGIERVWYETNTQKKWKSMKFRLGARGKGNKIRQLKGRQLGTTIKRRKDIMVQKIAISSWGVNRSGGEVGNRAKNNKRRDMEKICEKCARKKRGRPKVT